MPKLIVINETVTECWECYYRGGYSLTNDGWQVTCMKQAEREVPDPHTIPPWCPLPDAPKTAPVERRCGTCKWWKLREYTVEGRPVGGCQVPLAEWIELSDDYGNGMEESEGTDCPAWAAKEGM